jgi:hypothetical protein
VRAPPSPRICSIGSTRICAGSWQPTVRRRFRNPCAQIDAILQKFGTAPLD